MTQFLTQNSDIILKLVVAVILGMFIGIERLFMHKEAGMKTHALVALGACVFIIISETMASQYGEFSSFDPSRIASQIIVGIGFLTAGSIILLGNRLTGLTTAGGLWVTAGIGMAVGFGLFPLAVLTTIFVLLVFIVVNVFEKPVRKISTDLNENN